MYKFTLRRPYVDIMIEYLDRIQLGYSALVAHGMEEGLNENEILADIESMVRRCFTDENINVINNANFSTLLRTEESIKELSELIFIQLKKCNNY